MNSRNLRLPFLILFSLTLAHADDVRNGQDVLRAMHDRYSKTWYETLTFTQKSTTYNADGTTKVETWHEALSLPAKLRIDIGPPTDNNGYLMVEGTLTVLKDGKEVATRPLVNMLLVLGFDVYRQNPAATAKVAKDEGYDLTKVHEDTWQGQPVYVVGAEKGDLKSKQFWARWPEAGWRQRWKSMWMTRKFSARNIPTSKSMRNSQQAHLTPSNSTPRTGRSPKELWRSLLQSPSCQDSCEMPPL